MLTNTRQVIIIAVLGDKELTPNEIMAGYEERYKQKLSKGGLYVTLDRMMAAKLLIKNGKNPKHTLYSSTAKAKTALNDFRKSIS